jgi:TetR/AcrR family transcriptional regulator, cholesterol catabolism regulator
MTAQTGALMSTASEPQEPASRRGSDRSESTRAALIDLAAKLFATRGYAETSMRDIAREGPVSMGAIYLHFKNKVDLLVEALEAKIDEDLEGVAPEGSVDHVERLTEAGRDIELRRDLRALLVQAAAAAQTDDDARARIRDAQQAHVDDWTVRYEADRARLELDVDLDLPTAVLYTWAAELGLGMLEAFGMEPLDPEGWADIQNRVARSFRLPKDTGSGPRAAR